MSAKIYQGQLVTIVKIKSDVVDMYMRFYDVDENHYLNQGIEIETFLHKVNPN